MTFKWLLPVLLFEYVITGAGSSANSDTPTTTCRDEHVSRGGALLQKELVRGKLAAGASHAGTDGDMLVGEAPGFPKTNSSSDGTVTHLEIISQRVDEDGLKVPLERYCKETMTSMVVRQPRAPKDFKLSFLHDLVGRDGVKVISLDRKPERFEYSASALAQGGVFATSFSGTDYMNATDERLALGSSSNLMWNQAVADSHRRALIAASFRRVAWTLILEDDVALIDPPRWNDAFIAAWNKIMEKAPDTKIVRMSWCMKVPPDKDTNELFADAGEFILTKWTAVDKKPYFIGQCTGGYMVHQDIVPEMIKLFPCSGAVDNCYLEWLDENLEDGQPRGMHIMVNLAVKDDRNKTAAASGYDHGQHGILYQDRDAVATTKFELHAGDRRAA